MPDLNKTWVFSTDLEKNLNIEFHENTSAGAEFFHADRQTDMTKLVVDLRSFSNGPKKKNSVLKEAVADKPNA